jgi:hypothetical protein
MTKLFLEVNDLEGGKPPLVLLDASQVPKSVVPRLSVLVIALPSAISVVAAATFRAVRPQLTAHHFCPFSTFALTKENRTPTFISGNEFQHAQTAICFARQIEDRVALAVDIKNSYAVCARAVHR